MRQNVRGDAAVIADQVAFCVAFLRQEHLFFVGDGERPRVHRDGRSRPPRDRAAALHATSAVCSVRSRPTERAVTSRRSPTKTGWRMTASRVHSPKRISATNFGLAQCAGVSVLGEFSNGGVLRSSGLSCAAISRSFFSSKPVPTDPTYTNLPLSS